MSHFAKLDENNVVIFVTVGRDEDDGKELELSARTGDVYKQTSYNTRGGLHYGRDGKPDGGVALRKNYAGIGYTYDAQRDAFIPPKDHASWILNDQSCLWEAPIPYPKDGNTYYWDETELNWKKT
jgi:hypothetical protein